MNIVWQRVRAALRIGLMWAAAGCGAGLLLARVSSFRPDLPFALLFAPLGFAAGITFAGILAVIERRGEIDHASLPVFAGLGAVSGLVLSGLFVAGAALRGSSAWGEFLLFGPGLVLGSAVCAAGSMALARRDQRGERGQDAGGTTRR